MAEDLGTICNHVISYFAWRFNRPPGDFKAATRVRNAFRNDEAWAALADTFNSMPWMQAIGVMLSQDDMGAQHGSILQLAARHRAFRGTHRF